MLSSLLLIHLVSLALLLFFIIRSTAAFSKLLQQHQNHNQLQEMLHRLLTEQRQEQQEQRQRFDEHQLKTLKLLQESLSHGMQDVRQQINITLQQQTANLSQNVEKLTQETQQRLKEISGHVDKKLNEGFEKTNQTFLGVLQRLTIIDEAQKKITELSSNVVSLQEVLSDKRSRGAFGEVQLTALIRNMLPEAHFGLQYELSNQTRADCILYLPEPTGNIVIDAKFPLESYHKFMDEKSNSAEKQKAITQFRQDVRKHIKDIAAKYIIPGETADGAMMFIPAEAIFAEIHSHFSDVVEFAHQARVWLVSPTTMMAILTTARAVIKDAATRKQVHIIQEHLIALNQDFFRFQDRMDKLAKHIQQAHQDVEQVHKSSRKITNRFQKIEQVELDHGMKELETLTEAS
ncbi:MAG: recombinase RmuC [Coxiella sp. RIFCSPHIGHO2_12_FULL_42_15]|nr:MAG: recombinase RmuC [Coxiella sp. RIFCSPHIGHO2_12_FULL_42_15]